MIAGLLTAAVAVGVGQLIAGFTGPEGSPVVAVGSLSIDFTPPQVKDFAIKAFGTHDKLILVTGILVLLAVFAAWIGTLAMRKFTRGLEALAIFTAVGLLSSATRPGSTPADTLPTILGSGAAVISLYYLVKAAGVTDLLPGRTPPPQLPARPAGTVERPSGPGRAGRPPAVAPPMGPPGRVPPGQPPQPDRRRFIVTSAAVAGGAAVAGLAGRKLAEDSSVTKERATIRVPAAATPAPELPPGTHFDIPGLSSFITPNSSFYRVDTAIVLPEVPATSWSLRIHGMVERELEISFKELLKQPLIEDYITLTCVSNEVGGPYVGNAKWLGASLSRLLRQAGIKAGADQIVATSADGFTSGTPIQAVMDGRDALLAIAMNGTALPVAHGFPVRMVVPGLYGYVSACKWITDIEVTTFAQNHAYWTTRGWDQQAPIKTESRIDVPTGLTTQNPGKIAVAGVAWAQHKGIEAVEARADNGPWHEARLATVPGIDTWRQWVWEWDATPGRHLIQVRATDKTGYTQTALEAAPPPNGASGYPGVEVTING
jgi:DMSO/TMAO reductase YedYZ molybdopterin-dependent catalytic subunit